MTPEFNPRYRLDLFTKKLSKGEGQLPILDITNHNNGMLQIGLNIPHSKHKNYFKELIGNNPRINLNRNTTLNTIFQNLYYIFETDSIISTFNWNKINEYNISFSDRRLEQILLDESKSLSQSKAKKLINDKNKIVGNIRLLDHIINNPKEYPDILDLLNPYDRKKLHYELKFYLNSSKATNGEEIIEKGDIYLRDVRMDKLSSIDEIPTSHLSGVFSDVSKMRTTLYQRANKMYSESISTFKIKEPFKKYRKRQVRIKLV